MDECGWKRIANQARRSSCIASANAGSGSANGGSREGGSVAVYTDVTELKCREVELAEFVRKLELARDQAMEATRAKSVFLANMSHELRTPLNAIIGFTRLVMRRSKDVLPAKQYENLEKILISGEHLLSLINAVLDLSKIEAGRIEVRPVEFALEPLVDLCLRTVEPMLRGDRVRLTKDVEPGLPTAGAGPGEGPADPHQPARQRGQVHRGWLDHRARLAAMARRWSSRCRTPASASPSRRAS